MPEPLLRVEHVSKAYQIPTGKPFVKQSIPALEDVSLTIHKGETVGLIGESGCGKSTLGQIIARLLPPDEGLVAFRGKSLWDKNVTFDRHSIQMVFQDLGSALNPSRPIRWMLSEALRAKGITRREEQERVVDAMLPRVGLDRGYLARYPHELSGGQKQRVAILLAILLEPQLIIADEVASSLDVSVRAQILNLMRELQQAMGLSCLFISHDIGTVYYMAHRIAVMYLGDIVEEGSAEQVYRGGLHPYTRLLLRSQPDHKAIREQELPVERAGELSGRMRFACGCRFADRCPIVQEDCRRAKPLLEEREPGHRVRCPYGMGMGNAR